MAENYSMISHTLKQTCFILHSSKNKFGDDELDIISQINCRFRHITDLDQINNQEQIRADAMLWVAPEELVFKGTIIQYNGENYRVRQITEARRLIGEKVYFKKCVLDKYASFDENNS